MSTSTVVFFLILAVVLSVVAAWTPTPSRTEIPDGDEFTNAPASTGRFSGATNMFTAQVGLLMPRSLTEAASKAEGTVGLLRRSGNPWNVTPTQFLTLRMGLTGLGVFIGAALPSLGYPLPIAATVPVLGLAGYLIPRVLLDSAWSKRRNDLLFGLPEALDLIRIALGAGYNFTNALSEAMSHMRESVTRTELLLTADAIRSGKSVEQALLELRDRCPTDEVDAFCRAVLQGERIGTDVSRTLENQAAEARRSYERTIEVRAQKMQTSLFIPILALLLPALCIFLFGAAFDSLMNML